MRVQTNIRALFYGLMTIAAGALAALGLTMYLQGLTVPASLLNARLAQRIASRYGLRYRVDALRIGCLRWNCRGDINVGAVRLEFNTPETVRIDLNDATWNRGSPVTADRLEIRAGTRPPTLSMENVQIDPRSGHTVANGLKVQLVPEDPASEVGKVELDGVTRGVIADAIRIRMKDRPPLYLEKVAVEGWQRSSVNGWIVFDRFDAGGVKLMLDNSISPANICRPMPASDRLARATAPFRPLLPLFHDASLKLRADLLRIALVIAAVVVVLKLVTLLWLRRWSTRLALAVIPAVVPFAIYFFLREMVPLRLISAAGAALAAVALLFGLFVYRRGKTWYQRWEPVAVDLGAAVIILLLLGYGFECPALPDPPAGYQLDRINMTSVEGQSGEGVQFRIPQTLIRSVRLALPDSNNKLLRLNVASVEVPNGNVSQLASSRVTVQDVQVRSVEAAYDPGRREIVNLSAGVRLAGLMESNGFRRQLHNIEFLRGMNTQPQRVMFDLDVSAAFAPRDCTANYDLTARIRTKPLMLFARADGDTRRIHIRSLRSLPGSPVQFRRGTGTVVMNGGTPGIDLSLEAIDASFGSAQVSVDSIQLSTGLQKVAASLGTTNIRAPKGWQVRFGNATLSAGRGALKTRIEDIRIEGPENGTVKADLPVIETSVLGETTPEVIPRNFTGTVAFQITGRDRANVRLGTDKPISLNIDIWKGLLDVPQQDVTFRQSVFSETSEELPVRFELSARLPSLFPRVTTEIRTQAAISRLEQMLGSAHVILNEAQIGGRISVNADGPSATLNYRTGWNSVELQPQPAAFCLDEVASFDMSASGKFSKIAGMPSFTAVDQATPLTCMSGPSLPKALRFRLSGVLPSGPEKYAVQFEREDGTGIRIGDIESELQSLRIVDGHLEEDHTKTTLSRIQDFRGQEEFQIRNDLHRTASALESSFALLNTGGTPFLEAILSTTPARITLDATQHVPADQILDRLEPLFPDLASGLGSLQPKARLAHLHAEANFNGNTLLDAAAVAQLEGGAILSVDSSHRKLNVSTPTGSAGPALRLNIDRPSGSEGTRLVRAGIDLRDATIHSLTDQKVESDIHATLRMEMNGSLFTSSKPPVRPILDSVFQVSLGSSRQASQIAKLLNTDAPQALNNLEWNFHLTETSKPMLEVKPDALQVRIEAASYDASWEGADGGENRAKISGSGLLDLTLTQADDHLLLDALSPFPIQVAFAGRLREAPQKSDTLWNDEFYSQFWREHPPRFSGTPFTSLLDVGEMPLGALSLRQIRFPDKPPQISIGYSDALQVRLPISGQALFGSVDGLLESSLTATSTAATLDTRLSLDVKKIQADAFETLRGGSYAALVEDELDGNISVHLDGLTMDQDTLQAIRSGKFTTDGLEKINMSVHIVRSPEAANLRGVFQSSSNVEINLANKVLNQIAKDLRLTSPPRALTYKNFALNFEVDHGQVRTNRDILKFGGLQLFSSNFIDVEAEFRVYAGRPGERIMLGDLMEMLR